MSDVQPIINILIVGVICFELLKISFNYIRLDDHIIQINIRDVGSGIFMVRCLRARHCRYILNHYGHISSVSFLTRIIILFYL